MAVLGSHEPLQGWQQREWPEHPIVLPLLLRCGRLWGLHAAAVLGLYEPLQSRQQREWPEHPSVLPQLLRFCFPIIPRGCKRRRCSVCMSSCDACPTEAGVAGAHDCAATAATVLILLHTEGLQTAVMVGLHESPRHR